MILQGGHDKRKMLPLLLKRGCNSHCLLHSLLLMMLIGQNKALSLLLLLLAECGQLLLITTGGVLHHYRLLRGCCRCCRRCCCHNNGAIGSVGVLKHQLALGLLLILLLLSLLLLLLGLLLLGLLLLLKSLLLYCGLVGLLIGGVEGCLVLTHVLWCRSRCHSLLMRCYCWMVLLTRYHIGHNLQEDHAEVGSPEHTTSVS